MFAVCSPLSFAVLGAISNVGFGRRSAVAGAVAAAVLELPFPAFAGSKEDQAAEQIRLASAALHNLILNKSDFVQALVEGRSDGIQLPPAVPFTTFQALENTAEPEFMSIAIDYAEAARAARDLVKLAKLTKQPVEVSVKEAGKPRRTEVKEYGEAEGSGLSTPKEYAERALQEALGASVCLDQAMKLMIAK